MTEEYVIKRKLLYDIEGNEHGKKIHNFIKLLSKWILENEDKRESDTKFNKLCADLNTIISNHKKSNLLQKRKLKQIKLFRSLYRHYEEQIKILKANLKKQKVLLQNAKIISKNYTSYTLLIKMIRRQETRHFYNNKIDSIKNEISSLLIEKDKLNKKYHSKIHQCTVLSMSAQHLCQTE
ncbi:hypothetical protein GWI33_008198 [Rhynchophorus ferrugineus]|uniref:Uncharacterized protein n=1 Tax=Rhynchophorus ferrugineus TaxID=354439 RepID=A0A834MB96_RHYFE|nr:hypothetical protein GWI33_008198 [Rhynchophorus ferrugineus]